MKTEKQMRLSARELRNYANTLLNIGGATGAYIADLLTLATALDGNQPDERFRDIPYRLANPRSPL